jgi:AcrR family transcriptional regulator
MERSRAQTRRGPGRPRSKAADEAIAAATVALLGEGGFAALTMEAVASRAGISKHTLYRRAASPVALVIGFVEGLPADTAPVPDSGDFERDVRDLARNAADLIGASPFSRVLPAVVGAMAHEPALAAAAADYFVRRRAALRPVFERAVGRGELPPDSDPDVLIDLLIAPLYFRRLITREPIDDAFIDAVVSSVLLHSHPAARKDT